MCWKRCTDKKVLEAPFYNEEVAFKYPNGSPMTKFQKVGDVTFGTIDYDKDGNELHFKSKEDRFKYVCDRASKEKMRKMDMLEYDYIPKNQDEVIEILIYRAEEMRLHSQVEGLERIRCQLLQSQMKFKDIDIPFNEMNWTWGGGTAQDKVIQDEALAIIQQWEETLYIDIKGSIPQAILKRQEELNVLRKYFNDNTQPKGSPEHTEIQDFEGSRKDFAFKWALVWIEEKDNPKSPYYHKGWCKNRLTLYRWLKFGWTINGDEFTAYQLQSILTSEDFNSYLEDEALAKEQENN